MLEVPTSKMIHRPDNATHIAAKKCELPTCKICSLDEHGIEKNY
jgi:hypothetical protein